MKSSPVFYSTVFVLALALHTPAAFAQTPEPSPTTAATTMADVDDDDGDHGLWGLLGLIGLAGLIRRKDHHVDTTRDTTRRT